jgi:hypothetical protein
VTAVSSAVRTLFSIGLKTLVQMQLRRLLDPVHPARQLVTHEEVV